MATKILIIGGTGNMGKFLVEASAKSGHPTFVLVRDASLTDPFKSQLIDSFKSLGVTIVYGDLFDHVSLVKAIKQVDVVISSLGHRQLADQDKLLAAIVEAGNVKRFFPSEFGQDADRVNAVEPAKSGYALKAQFRRAVEAAGVPFTYLACNFFAGYFLPNLAQTGAAAPPRDKAIILGDGTPKGLTPVYDLSLQWYITKKKTSPTYTIKSVDDPRTLNKILYVMPPHNTLSFNDVLSLWEKKIGKTLEKIFVPEEQVLKNIKEAPLPVSVMLSIGHSAFVKGDQTNFEIEPSFGLEASTLYPDVKYTTVDEYLNQFV